MATSVSAEAPTPFTVIGGFLGAGKTTLLNRVLSDTAAPRCAVLVNDFGAIDIDASLIREHDGETLALANGCVCCSLASGFIKVMLKVTAERHRFDHVVVEASGVSEPQRIMDIARLDPELVPNAIITVVDACELATRLADPTTAGLVGVQLKAADLVLLNKVDRVDAAVLAASVELVQAQNIRAGIVRTTNADVPLSLIFGGGPESGSGTYCSGGPDTTRADSHQRAGEPRPEPWAKSEDRYEHEHEHEHAQEYEYAYEYEREREHEHEHAHRHEREIVARQGHTTHATVDLFHSTSMTSSMALTRTALEQLDASLGAHIIRAKGIVELEGEPGRWSWQRVGGLSRIEALAGERSIADAVARLPFTAVLIATAPIDPDVLALPEGVIASATDH